MHNVFVSQACRPPPLALSLACTRLKSYCTPNERPLCHTPLCQAAGTAKVEQNTWVSDSMAIKAQQLVYMNARGPGCFDFRFYVQVRRGERCPAGLGWEADAGGGG